MKSASVNEIKQKLQELDKKELIGLCQRLARFKKENKELLTYLLFEDLQTFIASVKREIDESFAGVNTSSLFFATKTLRKILRTTNRYIRYTGDKCAEADILLHYLTNLNGLKLGWRKSAALVKLYKTQFAKIEAAVAGMHEDLQYDYNRELQRLRF